MGCHTIGEFIKRETDIAIIDKLKPFLIEDGGYTRDICAAELKANWQNVCVITCIVGDVVRGFLIAVHVYDRCFLNQAYSDANLKDAQIGMDMLKQWAVERDCKEIRFETEKTSVYTRALKDWGFELVSYVMRYKL